MPGLTELAAEGDLRQLEDQWLEMVESGIPPEEAAGVFAALDSRGESALAVQLLDLSLESMGARSATVPPEFLRASAPWFDSAPQLRSLLIEMLRDEFLMFEPLEGFLRTSGLLDGAASLRQAWQRMLSLLRYREGAWVLSETMGPGRIVRMTRDSAAVDFDGSPSYGMKLEALLDSTRPLPPDSPAILRRLDPDAFHRLLENPPALLEKLLGEAGGRLSKAEASALAGPKEAAETWKKLLDAAAKDPLMIPSGDAIEARGSAPSDQVILGILSSRGPLDGRVREVARVLRQVARDRRAEVCASVLEKLPKIRSPETGALFELRWLLSGEPAAGQLPEGVAALIERSAAKAVRAIGEVGSAQCRRVYLSAFVEQADEDTMREFLDALPRNLWMLALETARSSRPGPAGAYLDSLLATRADPDMHLRAVEALLSWDLPDPPGYDAVSCVLEMIPRARADQARRSIQALLERRHEELQSYLRSLDTRRLSLLADAMADVGAAQDTGLVLEVLREHSTRRTGTSERADFWEGDYVYDSPDAIDRRRDALRRMRNEEVPAAARAIAEAASHGDLSENAEYKTALERRDLLLDSIRRGLKQLEKLRPYPVRDISRSVCSPGTRVRLETEDGSEAVELSLVGPLEASPEEGRINYLAPLGTSLLGCAKGDWIEIPADGRRFRVSTIEILPEAADR